MLKERCVNSLLRLDKYIEIPNEEGHRVFNKNIIRSLLLVLCTTTSQASQHPEFGEIGLETNNKSNLIVILSPWKYPYHKITSEIDRENKILVIDVNALRDGDINFFEKHYTKVIPFTDYRDDQKLTDELLKLFRENPFRTLIAIDEFDIIRAGNIREKLGLDGQKYQSALAFRSKVVMKDHLSRQGICVPSYQFVEETRDLILFSEKMGYPFIVKPVSEASSRDVNLIESREDLNRLLSNQSLVDSYLERGCEVESFIDGCMYHVDGLIYEGNDLVCWPSVYINNGMKMVRKGSHFGWYLLSEENALADRLNNFARTVLKALPTPPNTAFHLEVFHTNDDKLVFCEIASRVGGGGINQDWIDAFDIDLVAEFIRLQAGLRPTNSAFMFSKKPKFIQGFLFFPVQEGRLEEIAEESPFSWVQEYSLNFKAPVVLAKPVLMTDTLSRVRFRASNEDEFRERIALLLEWYKATTKIASL